MWYNAAMRKILLSTLLGTLLFAATPEQVEHYLSISGANEQLVELEREFTKMQNSLNRIGGDTETPNYDMQLLSIRFKEYLQKHLSEDEMEQILKAYRNVLLLQFVSATTQREEDKAQQGKYHEVLANDPEADSRKALVEKISDAIYDQESTAVMFDHLIKPLLTTAPGGNKLSDKMLQERRKAYIARMIEEARQEILYATRNFDMEELESLEQIVKNPAIAKETKAVYEATAYALEAFFLSLASRYDLSKHTPAPTKEDKRTLR